MLKLIEQDAISTLTLNSRVILLMGYDGYDDEYEYDDEEYYDDDEEYLDYTEDEESSSSRRSRFGGGSGLPGSSSSGSRFGGSGSSSSSSSSGSSRFGNSGGSSSRFGGSSSSRFGSSSKDKDDDSSSSSRFGGSSSSRFGGSSSGSSGSGSSGSSRFGGSSSSRFGSSSKDDDDSKSSGSSSRFGGSSSSGSSSSGSSRFGGSSSSRFGSSSKDDDSKTSGSSSRFGGSSSGSSSSSSSGSSRFGSSKKDNDDKKSSGSSRFGGSSSSRFGGSKKDDDNKSSGSRFGSQSTKSDDKKDDKSDESSGGGLLGSVTGLFGGGSSSDDKKDGESSGGGVFGGIRSRFGGGGDKSDDKKDDSKSSSGSRFGSGRFGSSSSKSGGDSKDDSKSSSGSRFGSRSSSKSDDKKDDSKSSSGSRFGSGRFGSSSSKSGGDSKDDSKSSSGSRFGSRSKSNDKDDKSGKSSKQSPFGARRSSGKSDDKGAKTAAATAQADESSGVLGRITGLFGRGSSSDDKSSKSSSRSSRSRAPKVPKAQTSDGLTLDNWLDIIGVGLVVLSLVLIFSGLSKEQAAIGAIHTFIGQLFGWGAIAVPVVMFVIGVWLIVRHFGDEAPTVDPVRVVGVAMIFIAMLYFFQWYDSFSYVGITADDGTTTHVLLRARLDMAWREQLAGGGIIGAELYFLMVTTVTDIGGFFLMSFVALIGIMFMTRMSAAEILRAIAGMSLAMREGMKQRAVQKRAERQLAAREAAEEQARLVAAGIAPPLETATVAQAAGAATDPGASGREIRMTVGGHAETVSMAGQQNAQGQPQPAYGPPLQSMSMQPAPQQSNGSGGLFGRLRGNSSNNQNNSGSSFSLFGGRSNGNTVSSPPPPASIPENPLPMDDGYSHFDTGPFKPSKAPAPPQRLGDMLREQPAAQATDPAATTPEQAQPAAQAPQQAQAKAAQPQPNREVEAAKETQEVNDFLKQRQDRLDKLRKGEIGPISQSAMARARQEDVSSVIVPSNEGQREESFSSKFSTGIGEAVRAEASQQSGDGSSSNFTPPSKLPSVQSDGDTGPKQQRLSVPVDEPKSSAVESNKVRITWRLPDYRTLLSSGSEQEFDREYLLKQARTIEETLEAFGAPGRVVEVNTGPVITQFGVEPDYISGRGGRKQRVKVSAIAGLDKDLQLALGARSIRVEAPVPGKGYVGVEVPNAESTLVSLRDVMDSPSFAKHKSPLAIALGQSVSGAPISADLSSMPHLLIAGTTGSGKSVCVNSIIASILSRNTPEQVKFIMVDPKRVELTGYNGIPHLVAPVVVELERIVGVLKWVTREMDARYKQFSEAGARNIEDFNKHRDPNTTEQMPYMVVIIDELADLMMLAPEETERTITRIAALARATGIHLVIATQRPSVDVVTGLIKANFPARIAFAVAGSVDSRVILDQPGAERLLGKGDMLYLSGDSPAALRLQGVYVSDMEINNIVRYWKMQGLKQPDAVNTGKLSSKFVVEQSKPIPTKSNGGNGGAFWDSDDSGGADELPLFAAAKRTSEVASAQSDDSEDVELTRRELTGDVKDGNEDELYDKAVELVRRLDKASISLLQRRLRIGYTRAARLIDVMEARGVVGPSKDGSSKPRDVLPES